MRDTACISIVTLLSTIAGGCSCSPETLPADAVAQRRLERSVPPAEPQGEQNNTADGVRSPSTTNPSTTATSVASANEDPTSRQPSANSGDTKMQDPSTQQAVDEANRLLERARRAANSGDQGKAFESALSAWQVLRPHAADVEGRRLSGEAMDLMEQYGEAANRNLSDGAEFELSRKRLRIE